MLPLYLFIKSTPFQLRQIIRGSVSQTVECFSQYNFKATPPTHSSTSNRLTHPVVSEDSMSGLGDVFSTYLASQDCSVNIRYPKCSRVGLLTGIHEVPKQNIR